MRARTRSLILTGLLALLVLAVAAAATEPTCQPVTPGAPVCLTAHDCEGLVSPLTCVGEWTCVDAACVFVCGGGWTDLPTKQSACTNGDPYGPDQSKVSATVQGDELTVLHQTVTLNCCDVIQMQLDASEPGVLDVIETRTPESAPCDCMCTFDLEATLADLAPGAYLLRVWSEGKAHLYATLALTIAAPAPCAAPDAYQPVSLDKLVDASQALDGMLVSVDGPVSVGSVYCTMMACMPENPCCNSCGASYQVGGDPNAPVTLTAGDVAPVGCSGNECTLLQGCQPLTPGLTYRLWGRWHASAYGIGSLALDGYCQPE